MHIKIEAECTRGLRIIEEIPDLSICKIEGYNGIGKTNAIKLLQLCTGGQPFSSEDPSWRSFRTQIVSARVRITGLREVGEIEWILEPRRWPAQAEPLGDLLGAVRIAGQEARPRDTLPLVKVHHVSVAETPLKALADRVTEAQNQVSIWVQESGQKRQETLDGLLEQVAKKIADSKPETLHSEVLAAQEAKKRAGTLSTKLSKARGRVDLFDRAVETADQLDQVRGRGPELDAKLEELDAQLEELEIRKEQLNSQISTASARQHQDEQADHEFDLAQKHLDRQDQALREAEAALERSAAKAGISPDREGLEQRREADSKRLNRLTEILPHVNSVPLVIDILEDLTLRLEDAEHDGLNDVTLIEAEDRNSGWTVEQLKTALANQLEALRNKAPSTDSDKLTNEIASARRQLHLLSDVEGALRNVEQAQERLTKAQGRLGTAARNLPGASTRSLDELISNRNDVDNSSRQLQAEHARVEQARELLGGGMSEEALAATLATLCAEIDVEPARVRGRSQTARNELDDVIKRESQGTHQAEKAARAAAEHRKNVAATFSWLHSNDELAWLRNAVPQIISNIDADEEQQAEILQNIAARIENGRNSLANTFYAVQGIGAALSSLAMRVNNPVAVARSTDFDMATQHWLSEEVRQWFDDELVREALFDSGDNIRLDANDLTVTWTVDGKAHERPLLAFSSGQQAFAYAQAQVSRLDREENPPANRLIALDEFNALLDRERMSSLANYLIARQQTAERDQVVVILPLETIPSRSSSADERSLTRARDLERRGYIAEELLP
ncbi:hypothetical protein ACFORO_26310 [Amycolatopsis halotolerans]|uniref:Rad50/SbcC-type AAA domain-containing protein n=1 Tax=Amycolatopsis halotolerans TaxID=330083 RepID=A0ABV7QKJ8_9PSEU